MPFYEVFIETNGYNINLVFSDFSVRQVASGYAPFTAVRTRNLRSLRRTTRERSPFPD